MIMASLDYKDAQSTGHSPVPTTDIVSFATNIDLPAVETLLPDITDLGKLSVVSTEQKLSSEEEQYQMFRSLQNVLSKAQANKDVFDVQELYKALEEAHTASQEDGSSTQHLESVVSMLQKLWLSRSKYLLEATEALANASRDREC